MTAPNPREELVDRMLERFFGLFESNADTARAILAALDAAEFPAPTSLYDGIPAWEISKAYLRRIQIEVSANFDPPPSWEVIEDVLRVHKHLRSLPVQPSDAGGDE